MQPAVGDSKRVPSEKRQMGSRRSCIFSTCAKVPVIAGRIPVQRVKAGVEILGDAVLVILQPDGLSGRGRGAMDVQILEVLVGARPTSTRPR
jgi:hypothetical protein